MAQVFNKEKKAQIRGELEDLLSTYQGGPNPVDDIADSQLGEIAMAPPLDFEEMNSNFEKQAKDITNSMLKFYVELGVLEKHEYLKQKQILDNSNIQNIFFQLKTIRMAIEKITEEINQGNTHPRLFEVFGQLQDKLTMVVKTQANYMLFLEDTYKKVHQDIEQRGSGSSKSVTPLIESSNEYYITAGTKNLIKENKNYPIMLVFFDGEEAIDGPWTSSNSLSGSSYFVNNYDTNLIDKVYIFDLIGGDFNQNKIAAFSNNKSTASDLIKLAKINEKFTEKIFQHPNDYISDKAIQDDHVPFVNKNIYALNLIPYNFPNNHHTLNDNYENVNWKYVEIFYSVLFEFLKT